MADERTRRLAEVALVRSGLTERQARAVVLEQIRAERRAGRRHWIHRRARRV